MIKGSFLHDWIRDLIGLLNMFFIKIEYNHDPGFRYAQIKGILRCSIFFLGFVRSKSINLDKQICHWRLLKGINYS